jgi:hypothetical protein
MATTRGTRSKKVEQVEVQATLDAVKNLDTARVVSEVNNLQVTLQSTLADVSASITSKIQQISTIDEAIALKNARLKELFGIEAEAVLLDDLKAQREQEKLDAAKESDERRLSLQEEEAAYAKRRQREEEEWKYAFALRKQRAEEQLKAEIDDNIRNEKARQLVLDKEWGEREKALAAKEAEFAELKKQVEGFDARLKTELSKAEAILTNALKRQHEHEKALLQKDAESAKAVCEMRCASLEGRNKLQQEQIEDLKHQVVAARQDSKDVATAALSAQSDRKVAEAYRQVMDGRESAQGKVK